MASSPVILFGAGATRACGGPLTDEILPAMFAAFADAFRRKSDDPLSKLALEFGAFLRDSFHVALDERWTLAERAALPSLPLLLSLMDTAVDRGQAIGAYDVERLVQFKRVIQAGVFSAIDGSLRARKGAGRDPYTRLLEPLYQDPESPGPAVLTLNYDTLVDRAMLELGKPRGRRVADYGCDIALDGAGERARFGRLYKLHGSLNWLYCRRCARLSLHMAGLRETEGFWDALGDAFEDFSVAIALAGKADCDECRAPLGPLLITPSSLKDYRNPHVARVWYEAGRALRRADRAIFVGYSLPWDDVDVIYLLKQGLEHLAPEKITVVEYSADRAPIERHDAGRRYLSIFGSRIDWQPLGFEGWLDDCERRGESPIHGR